MQKLLPACALDDHYNVDNIDRFGDFHDEDDDGNADEEKDDDAAAAADDDDDAEDNATSHAHEVVPQCLAWL